MDKYSNNPLFKLKHTMRVSIYKAFKNGYKKKSRTEEILGCSYEFFMSYIESKFTEGMSWDNHGQSTTVDKWQLDHIIPINSANSEEEMIEINHYSNFQPLWESENKSKGDRIMKKKL